MKIAYFKFNKYPSGTDAAGLHLGLEDLSSADAISVVESIEALVNEMNGGGTLAAHRVAKPKPGVVEQPVPELAQTPRPSAAATEVGTFQAIDPKPADETPFEGSTPAAPETPAQDKPARTRKSKTRHPVEHTAITAAPPIGDAFYAEIIDTGIADGVPYMRVLETIQTKLTESFLVGSGPSETDLIELVKARYAAAASKDEVVEEPIDDEDEDTDEVDNLFGSADESTPAPKQEPKPTQTPAPKAEPKPEPKAEAQPAVGAGGADAELLAAVSGVTGMAAITRVLKGSGISAADALAFIIRHLSEPWVPKLAKAQFANASQDACSTIWAQFWDAV